MDAKICFVVAVVVVVFADFGLFFFKILISVSFVSVFRYSYLHVQRRDSDEPIQSTRPDTSGFCQGMCLSCFLF